MKKITAALIACMPLAAAAADRTAENATLAREIFKQLVEINTTDSVGNVSRASEAMALRLRKAGVPDRDIHVLGASDSKKNLVVRLRGNGSKRPALFIGHLDVVEAPRVDWATDPFQFVEKEGYFYGRGTQDMKAGDAIAVSTLIRLWKEGFKPTRDIIVALTAGEESFKNNGVKWLIEQHRELIDAEFVINMDGGGVLTESGRPVTVRVDAAEKLYADFRLSVINPGGTTALPVADNAIYQLAEGLIRLEHYRFPAELNPVTRAYFSRLASTAPEPRASELRALLKTPPEQGALENVSRDTLDNALLHTTCVAARLEGGHANNALPQMASAMVNCRILPGYSAETVRRTLVDVLDNPRIAVRYVREFDGREFEVAPDSTAAAASAPSAEVIAPLERIAMRRWPGAPVISGMAAGESDAVWTTAAGMPTYAFSGLAIDRGDVRAHGKDERLRVNSFFQGLEFFYEYVRDLAGS